MSGELGNIPVVILAGGMGKRLEAAVADRPKPLAPVGTRSFLEIQLSLLKEQGARRFVLCVGHRAEQIQAALQDGSGMGIRIEYSIETDILLGTAGALRNALDFFRPRALVLNGDTYLDIDYQRLVGHHESVRASHGAQATIALARRDDGSRFGSVLLDPEEKFVVEFREKDFGSGKGWLNAGAYVIERDLLGGVPQNTPCSLEKEVFPRVLRKGFRIVCYPCSQQFADIGTPDDYLRFKRWYEGMDRRRHGSETHRRAS
jgi:NDP-sugar pyrophosphorylase family protein